jgi:hypothetical protein
MRVGNTQESYTMKALTLSIALLALTTDACGSNEEAAPPPSMEAAPDSKAATGVERQPTIPLAAGATPQHGGTVVLAGTHPVEVVPHASGEVYAYMLAEAPAPTEVELRVEVPTAEQRPRDVTLVWNARSRRYEGRVRDVVIVPGPLVVHLTTGTHVWIGQVVTIVVAPAIVVEVHQHRKHKKHKKHKKHWKH